MHTLPHSVPPTLQQATAVPCLCWRLLDTNRQVWVSLLWGHCSFLLGPGVHTVLFVPSKSLFHQSSVSSGGSVVGLRWPPPRGLMPYQDLLHLEPFPCSRPLLTHTSTGDIQTQFWLSLCGASGSWCAQGLFETSEHIWRVRGLILNGILPLQPSCWGFFALGCGVSFFGGIQHSPVNGYSVASCSFGIFTGKDEHVPFYSAILCHNEVKLELSINW